MDNINVDIRHVDTNEPLMDGVGLRINMDQQEAWQTLTAPLYQQGYRIVPSGRTLVDASVAVGGVDISKQAVERINATTMELRALDPAFLPSSTVRPFGTQIIENDGRQHEVRKDFFRDAPAAIEGARTMQATIASENREDFPFKLRDLNITEDGRFYVGDDVDGAFPMTGDGWKGLMTQVGKDNATWLTGMARAPKERTVENWRAFQRDYADPDKVIVGGIRSLDGDDQWWRFVSNKHSESKSSVKEDGEVQLGMGADELLGTLVDVLDGLPDGDEWRMRSQYDPNTGGISVDVLRQAPTIPGMGSGDVYQSGFRFTSGDGGKTGFTVQLLLMRNLCVNIMIVKEETLLKSMVTHRKGNESKAHNRIRETFTVAQKVLGIFAPNLAKTKAMPYNAKFKDAATVRDVYEAIANMKAMRKVTSAIAKDTAVEAMLLGWQQEPGDTLYSIINGVTRVHESKVAMKVVPLFEEAAPLLMAELVR